MTKRTKTIRTKAIKGTRNTGIAGVDYEIREIDGVAVAGSNNFLADRGHKDPAELRAKIMLAYNIRSLIKEHGWQQQEAAKLASLAQADISRIVRGLVRGYSVWKLAKVLTDLGATTKIVVYHSKEHIEEIAVA